MTISTLLAFALTFLVFAASPGPDNFTIFTRTLSGGLKAGIAYGLGTVTGILVFLTLGLAVSAMQRRRWRLIWCTSAWRVQPT